MEKFNFLQYLEKAIYDAIKSKNVVFDSQDNFQKKKRNKMKSNEKNEKE